MSRTEIPLTTEVDNTNNWSISPMSHVSRDRSIYLRFEARSVPPGITTYSVMARGDALRKYIDPGGGDWWEADLTIDSASLHDTIVEMQELWRDRVVKHREALPNGKWRFPFADSWDLSEDRDRDSRLSDVARPLAKVGYKLYRLLFYTSGNDLSMIGEALTAALRETSLVISIQSSSLFVPWWMLYTPPVGHEDLNPSRGQQVPWEGFWGYSHIIEHNFKHSPAWKPCIAIGGRGVIAGVNVDRNLDKQFSRAPSVAPVISMFQSTAAEAIVRESKDHLEQDLKSTHYGDHIMYFGCHGTGVSSTNEPAKAYLRLTDRQPIRSTDFMAWLAQTSLLSTPIVFVNACEGAQMSSLFYTAIGSVLIEKGANCLIGPQVEIPPAFAREYATTFFTQFNTVAMNRSDPESLVRAGDIFQRLAHDGIAVRKNPLGLVMSLYRGIDTHLCQQHGGQ
jgi:hypothetical protein